ncbi:hypothetical protein [Streptomyces scabiei]|uniref:hypothetical protein n=1 Tax=Streptomyces scabiei TaxID=1930 RepID=UPI0029A315E9|nr:hypothetical protein [Streptomyces scabiei]MDX3127288.1 hypothetical protein [Streptomyces scabiei]MDX3283327.1 hypothetical protein [Streptomyces scabiei]
MGTRKREYEGTGGLRLHLDDPPTPEMAKQIARGALRPVDGKDADVQAGNKALVVVDGADATTASRVGTHRRAPGEKPGDDATAGQWATYAVALGMEGTHASTLTLTQLQEWVAEHEKALGEGQEAPVPTTDPENPVEPLPDRPAKNAPVADWRKYAIALGMDPDEAKDATKADCQDYVQVVEDARNEDPTETTEE